VSWDVFASRFPAETRFIKELAKDWRPDPIGARADVINQILDVVPNADFSTDSDDGHIDSEGFSIEVTLGGGDRVDSIMFHVRGSGAPPLCVLKIIHRLGIRAYDCQTGEFLTADQSGKSFSDWQQYRDRVIEKKPPK